MFEGRAEPIPWSAGLVAKALGVVCTFATLAVAGQWARAEATASARGRPEDARIAAAVAVACAVAIPAITIHAVSGICLFRLLVTALLARAASEVRGDARSPHGLPLLAPANGAQWLSSPRGLVRALTALVARGARSATRSPRRF